MTTKKHAKKLVNKYLRIEDNTTFYWNGYYDQRMFDDEVLPHAKKCALITVDEIIEELLECGEVWMKSRIRYWQEVKQEIEKL